MMRFNKPQIFTGLALALVHLAIVVVIYTINVDSGDSFAPILWMLLAFLDYPVSLGLGWGALQRAGDYQWNNQLMPLYYFGSVGTIWWFCLGVLFSGFVQRLNKRFKKR